MHPSFRPPRQVMIGDAAWFAGTTPRAIRHYEQLGLLPEPDRGGGGRRRYDYAAVVRLLWIRRMADAGVALDDIRRAFDAAAPDSDVVVVLDRLEADLAAQEDELRRRRAAVQRMRARGSRLGLLDDFVAQRLEGLPEGFLSEARLDTLLVTERMLSPLGAAVHAGRYLALAAEPRLRQESDRLDAEEGALDDTVAVDDPRVARIAAERHAFEQELQAFIESSGQADEDDALFDRWDALHSAPDAEAEPAPAPKRRGRTALEALQTMPYDFSPARLRSLDIAEELAARDAASGQRS